MVYLCLFLALQDGLLVIKTELIHGLIKWVTGVMPLICAVRTPQVVGVHFVLGEMVKQLRSVFFNVWVVIIIS